MTRAAELRLPSGPRITAGFQEIVLSVFDIERVARPMVDIGAFELRALPDALSGQFAAWRVPADCTRIEQAYLWPVTSTTGRGGIRLVKFHGVAQRVMRSSQRSWDTGGIFDIDVYSRDVEGAYRRLQRYGWTALGDPVRYQEAQFDVTQVVAVGPDGLMVAIIQRHAPPVDDMPPFTAMSHVFNSTQMVKDYAQSRRFYCEILGWPPTTEFTIDAAAEPGVDVLGLPLPQAETAVRHIGMFKVPGAPDGAIELIENASMRARDFSEHCIAPNIGLLCLRGPVADAAGLAAAIQLRGWPLYIAPTAFELAPYGPVQLFSVRTPDGAILEFYQHLTQS